MYMQPDTYQLLICVATLGLTLTAGFLLGIMTSDRQLGKTHSQKMTQRH